MLVLTRKAKQEIRIGNDITVTIVRVKGQSVRIGINAPEHVHVVRSELVAMNGVPRDDRGTDGPTNGRGSRNGDAVNGESPRRAKDSGSDGADGAVKADPPPTNAGHNRRDVNDSSTEPKAVHFDACGGQARGPALGSTTTLARLLAHRRQTRTDPFVYLPTR